MANTTDGFVVSDTTSPRELTCRAKFKCESKKITTWANEYDFNPVISGSPENEAFFKTTPTGRITMCVKNEGVNFEVGKTYYIDFTPAE